MGGSNGFKRWFWRLIKAPPRIAYALGLGPAIGRLVLLLTTKGRRTGSPRVTPLQYEEIDGLFYVASATGSRADWFRNVRAEPRVEVRVKGRRFTGTAEIIIERGAIADFLELRLRRHPKMVGAMMRADGLPSRPTRTQLESYAAKLALVAIKPVEGL